MQTRISLTKIWCDDDVVELRVTVTDASSSFTNTVYVAEAALQTMAEELAVFRKHIYGGIKDLRFGAFGPEYANGAFQARLHFRTPGKLFISTHQQSQFFDFSMGQVASEARMYLVSEPVLLDNFIPELTRLANGAGEEAVLVCA